MNLDKLTMPGLGSAPKGWIMLLCGFVAGATLCCLATATATAIHNQQAFDNKLSSLEYIILLSTQPTVTEDLCATHHTAGKDGEKEGAIPAQSRGQAGW